MVRMNGEVTKNDEVHDALDTPLIAGCTRHVQISPIKNPPAGNGRVSGGFRNGSQLCADDVGRLEAFGPFAAADHGLRRNVISKSLHPFDRYGFPVLTSVQLEHVIPPVGVVSVERIPTSPDAATLGCILVRVAAGSVIG